MSNVLRLAVVDPNDNSRDKIKSLLLGMDLVWLEAECSRYEFFADVVDQTSPDVGVVCLDDDPEKGLALVSRLHESSSCAVLVVSSSDDGSLILRAMRAGAKEFLTQPITAEELIGALERISNSRSGGGKGKSRSCTTIAVAGTSGGVGSTSLAVNIGCALASDESNSVALVDLDMAVGDADVFLDAGRIPDYTLVDVSQNVSRLDFSLLKKSMTKHSSGLYLLPRPVHLQDAPLISLEDFQRVVGLLKATFSHLIFDLSKSYGALDMLAMRESKHVLLVTQLDLPCLRNVVRLMMSFDEEEGLKDKVKIVINRLGLDAEHIGLKKAQETINREIYWRIPNDYRSMAESRNNGVPLTIQAPKAAITQAVVNLAAALNGDETIEVDENAASVKRSGVKKWLPFLGRTS